MAEDNAIVKFDPNTFAERLKDKVRLDIMEAMSEDERKAFIRAAIVEFTQNQPKSQYDYSKPSSLTSIVHRILTETITEEAKREVENWMTAPWDVENHDAKTGKVVIQEALQNFVRDNAASLIRTFLEQALAQGLSNVFNNLRNGG